MDYKINCTYPVSKTYEFSMDYDGFNYLVIYGHHINGGFIAVPNWQICTEAAEPEDVFYNTEKLFRVLESPEAAKAIANAVRQHWQEINKTQAVETDNQGIDVTAGEPKDQELIQPLFEAEVGVEP